MERTCFTFTLKPGTEDEYRRRHDEIWPEMVAALRASGIRNYTLFRRGLEVIAYAECEPDAETAFAKMAATDVDKRWSDWFEEVLERRFDDDGQAMSVAEVWHLD
ncbi:MAG TPA: L-rhamnose mutarotase [Solirubrobacteraceae bacterium]|nr:L-rhamnose mutarotase [Solirubrobacteraceae bacterium]